MSNLTDFLENAIINHFFRNTSQAASGAYVALFSVMPAEDGTGGTEVTTTIRTAGRVAAGFSAPTGGSGIVTNAADVDFGLAAGAANLAGFGLFNAASGGNLLASKTFSGAQNILQDAPCKFLAGALSLTLA